MTESARASGRVNWINLVTVVSAAILIGTEIVGVGLATGWAIAGLFGLGDIGAYVLETLFVLGAFAIVVTFVRAAARIEPFVER